MTTTLQHTDFTPATDRSGFLLLPALIGFVFAFRVCLTVLWFQDEPESASILSVALSLILLTAAALSTIEAKRVLIMSRNLEPQLREIEKMISDMKGRP